MKPHQHQMKPVLPCQCIYGTFLFDSPKCEITVTVAGNETDSDMIFVQQNDSNISLSLVQAESLIKRLTDAVRYADTVERE